MTFSAPPQLDDVEFEQLVEEARALIPRYAPAWTDHNLHDPGITLLELLAWIVDQQIYQIGLVSDRHLRAFAALLGVRAKAAKPAAGLIWPNKIEGDLSHHVVLGEGDLRRGEKVTSLQQPEVVFVLDADIHLTAAQPKSNKMQALNGKGAINLAHFFQQPRASFDLQPGKPGSEMLELAFDGPLVRDGENPIAVGIEVESVPLAKVKKPTPWGPLFFEYKTDQLSWQPVSVVDDQTYSLARTGVVLLQIPPHKEAKESMLRLRLDRGYYPVPIQIVRMEINVLPIVQLEKRAQRVIGRSNGMPDQVFPLELTGLPDQTSTANGQQNASFPYSLRIEVTQAGVGQFDLWQESHDLSMNKPEDRVYQLDREREQIIFGNGINGAIPPNDAQIRHLDYHLTKGATGNQAPGLDWRVANVSVQGAYFGSNPDPVTGGEDAWNLERLMAEARERVLKRQVMLSNQDLLRQVKSLDGFAVARADYLARYHPAIPEQEIRGTRTVAVTPWRTQDKAISNAIVNERYSKAVAAAIEPYRVLGERLTVITHQRIRIRVKATLLIESGKDGEQVIVEAHKRLNARFTDLAMPDTDDEPWPLGRPVTRGEIQGLLAAIPDVIAISDCLLARENDAFGTLDTLTLKRDEVAIGADHEIAVRYLDTRPGEPS